MDSPAERARFFSLQNKLHALDLKVPMSTSSLLSKTSPSTPSAAGKIRGRHRYPPTPYRKPNALELLNRKQQKHMMVLKADRRTVREYQEVEESKHEASEARSLQKQHQASLTKSKEEQASQAAKAMAEASEKDMTLWTEACTAIESDDPMFKQRFDSVSARIDEYRGYETWMSNSQRYLEEAAGTLTASELQKEEDSIQEFMDSTISPFLDQLNKDKLLLDEEIEAHKALLKREALEKLRPAMPANQAKKPADVVMRGTEVSA
jgi:hypothetical protein